MLIISIDHFFLLLTFSYILNKSDANKLASKPPVPALISIIAFLLSASSFGNKNILIFFSCIKLLESKSLSSFSAISIISLSLSLSLIIFFSSFLFFSNEIYCFETSTISFKSEYSLDFSANFSLSISPDASSVSSFLCLEINSLTLLRGIIGFFFEFL